jgi:hypothetical protein
MSNLLTSVDLEAVTAGTPVARSPSSSTSSTSSTDALLQQLTSLQTTIQNIGNTANKTGFSTTDVLLLGLLLSQQQHQTVFVHRPFWW